MGTTTDTKKQTANGNVKTIPTTEIVVDKNQLQARERLSNQTISEYQEAYFEGEDMPPITLFQIEDNYYLVDGFHRLAAMSRLGFEEVVAEVKTGTFADALLYAAAANAKHGARRTAGDAKRAAIIAIRGLIEQNGGNKRPTVDQVKDLAKVGTSTVQAAFSDLEAAGMNLGEKDKRGRKRKATTETHTESDTETSTEDVSGLSQVERMVAQAAASKSGTEALMTDTRRRLAGLDKEAVADPGSEVRLTWVTVINMLNGLADEIREKIGMPTTGGSDF